MNSLFKIRGFPAYVLIIFCNAFLDLGHKIIIQNIIFKIYDGNVQVVLTAIINALMLLPFILLFSPSGHLADKYAKHLIIRYSALAVIGITTLITACYYAGWFHAAFALTLLLAAQSAIYSPAKYGYIRELVGTESIAAANGLVQAITIVAILGGTFVFSALFEWLLAGAVIDSTQQMVTVIAPLGFLLVILASTESALSWQLPAKQAAAPTRLFSGADYVQLRYLRSNMRAIFAQRTVWLSIVGLSVFWAISQVILAAFPSFAKEVLHETNTLVIQGLLACSGIGIMFGSLLAARISRHHIETGLIPVGAIGISVALALLPSQNSPLMFALLFIVIGTCGGLFIVPLNALVQYHPKTDELGTVLAGNNWVQNIAMLSFLALTVVLSLANISSIGLFYFLSVVALAGAIYTVWQLPHSLVRILATLLLKHRYKIQVVGFDHLPKQGAALLLGNHVSWIDWAMVQVACPRPVRFVMLADIYNRWYLKPLFQLFGVVPIASGRSKKSLETINELLKQGEVVCLFPEGAISRTGQLGEFKHGYELTVHDVDGVIIPFYLRGLWGSNFSRSSDKLRQIRRTGIKREIIVAFGAALPLDTRAPQLKQKVFELSVDAWERYTDHLPPIPLAWLQTARRDLSQFCAVDSTGEPMTQARMVAAVTAFASDIYRRSPQERIGILLPASTACIITNLAVMLNGQTAVNLNYTTSVEAVKGGITHADIKVVYSSEKFLQKLTQKGVAVDAMLEGVTVIPLETLKQQLPRWRLVVGLVAAYLLPARLLYRLFGRVRSVNDPAAVLFSSGSEGVPKGIVLSHRNLAANIKQISDVLNMRDDDVIIGSLPPFHSFGLTVTTLMPMVEGIPVVCHPDPTDVLNIAKAVARWDVTILCGTATFLRLYARNTKIDPLMLATLRIVVAGAEKLSNDVREAFQRKFNTVIYEGYGATETTPVASVNIPDQLDTSYWEVHRGHQPGTVGLPVPGSCFRVVNPETLAALPCGEDGLILISGMQVMLGYLKDPEKTDSAIVCIDGHRWYKSGDKGHLDEHGFLTIVDRYSRFAKIAGEMISLSAVEEMIRSVLNRDDVEFVAVNLPDPKKGERVVLLFKGDMPVDSLRQHLIDAQANPLMIPAEYFTVDAVPKLGSGKTDFAAAKKLAQSLMPATDLFSGL